MTNDALPEAAETYLRALGAELSDAPPDTVREIIEDVRAHITDALDSGRTMDQALAGLGSPQAVAGQARDELALPDGELDHAARAGRTLRAVAVALGVLTAVCVSFLLRTAVPLDLTQAGPDEQSIVERYGPGLAMLTLLPALIAAAPFALPARTRGVAGVAGAVFLTALTFVGGEIGLYYFPLVLLLWAASIVPSAIRRGIGRVAARSSWHVAAAVFVALPGLLTASSVATRTFGLDWVGVALWVVAPIVLGVLCACGIRAGYAVTALGGALVMILAMVERGFLFAGFWLFGGLYLMIGANGFVAVRAKTLNRVWQRPLAARRRPASPSGG